MVHEDIFSVILASLEVESGVLPWIPYSVRISKYKWPWWKASTQQASLNEAAKYRKVSEEQNEDHC